MNYIYLIRHGETLANVENEIQGKSDFHLTLKGKIAVKELALQFKRRKIKFDLAYLSDQIRAVETKRIILSTLGLSNSISRIDKRLREWDFGSFDGKDINSVFNDIVKVNNIRDKSNLLLEDVANYLYENDVLNEVESWENLKKRIWLSFLNIARHVTDNNILIVSHGLTILVLLYLLDKENLYFRIIKNGFVAVIKYENGLFKIDKLLSDF